MPAELRLWLLGGLTITVGQTPQTGFVSTKAQALLCYLVVTARPQPRAALADLLWGEMPEATAAANLRKALSNLHQLFGECLVITRQTVGLNPTGRCGLDVETFQAKLQAYTEEKNITALHEAVALYQGDFLHGFHVRNAPAFEEWLVLERERLREVALTALQTLADHHTTHREYVAGLNVTRRLLALEPWREETHQRLMLLLIRSGQPSAALAQYQACRRVLAEELGAEPMPATTALYHRIRAAAASPRHNLTPRTTPFVGREAELAHIARWLAQPECRLLTLLGLGGVGKTSLGQETARAQIEQFISGAFFISLAPIGSADFLIPAILTGLSLPLSGETAPHARLLDYLRDKEMLLVLDNFEHLLAGVSLLTDILTHAPEVKLLVTSRERLNLQAEWVFEVPGLATPPEGAATATIGDYAATRLFRQCAERAHTLSALADAELPHIAQICRLVEGMPLGIELAAASLTTQSCEVLADEIARNRDRLATTMADMPARHRSLRAAFDHSWGVLTPDEQRAFRRLSVFRGGLDPCAAQQVAGASPALLAALADKSLLRRVGTDRWEMHELLRQYAAGKLYEAGEVHETCRQHLDFFLHLAETAEPELRGTQQRQWLQYLEEEHDNLRAALDWSLTGSLVDPDFLVFESGLRLAGALGPFWLERGHWHEGRQWLERALALRAKHGNRFHEEVERAWLPASPTPPLSTRRPQTPRWKSAWAKALYEAGILAQVQSDSPRVRELAEQMLTLCRQLPGGWELAWALRLKAYGDISAFQAKALTEEALALFRKLQVPWSVAQTLNQLGHIEMLLQNYERTAALWDESLSLFNELADEQFIANTLADQGYLAYRRGNYIQATTLLEKALVILQGLEDKYHIAYALRLLGLVAQAQGDLRQAKTRYEADRALSEEIGNWQGISQSTWYLGRVALLMGELAESRQLLEKALYIARERGSTFAITWILQSLGTTCRYQSDFMRAQASFAESLTLAQTDKNREGIADALIGFAGILAAQGQSKKAARLYGAADSIYKNIGIPVASSMRAEYEQSVAIARSQIAPTAFTDAWDEGSILTSEQATAYALGESNNNQPTENHTTNRQTSTSPQVTLLQLP